MLQKERAPEALPDNKGINNKNAFKVYIFVVCFGKYGDWKHCNDCSERVKCAQVI